MSVASDDLPTGDSAEEAGYDYVSDNPLNSYDPLGLVSYQVCDVTGDVPKLEFYKAPAPGTKLGWKKKSRVYRRTCYFRCYCLNDPTCFKRPCLDPWCQLNKDHGVDESITLKGTEAAKPCKHYVDRAKERGNC
jgi:hypothetical protein